MFDFKVWARGWHYVYAFGRFTRSAAIDMMNILEFGTGKRPVAFAVMAVTAGLAFAFGGFLAVATAIGLTYLAVVIKKGFEHQEDVVAKPKEKPATAGSK